MRLSNASAGATLRSSAGPYSARDSYVIETARYANRGMEELQRRERIQWMLSRDEVIRDLERLGISRDVLEKSIPARVPPGVKIRQNMKEAEEMGWGEFKGAVQSGGKWDWKRGGNPQFEEFGNWHYGVMARVFMDSARVPNMAFSDEGKLHLALAAAGFYQAAITRTSKLEWISWYFDDPRDTAQIRSGDEVARLRNNTPRSDSR